MQVVHGDLIQLARDGAFDVIVHGCNCFCAMGAGIAKGIKAAFPDAYAADCATEAGDRDKLGTCTWAACPTPTGTVTVVNAYIQYHWKGRGMKVEYDALRRCFTWLRVTHGDRAIGIPKIGAGLAGGDWATISGIIAEEMAGCDLTLVEYVPVAG